MYEKIYLRNNSNAFHFYYPIIESSRDGVVSEKRFKEMHSHLKNKVITNIILHISSFGASLSICILELSM